MYLDANGLLCENQHGFRAMHSCESQLLITTTDFINSFDNKTPLDAIILDFAKAFDVVSHKKLITKMHALGINSSIIEWVKSWLKDRTHRISLGNSLSNPRPVTSGVPQGSVLGPLLFLIFINDMPLQVKHSELRLFADDSLLYKTIKSVSDRTKLQADLDNLTTWARDWQMRFNIYRSANSSKFGEIQTPASLIKWVECH